MQPSLLNEIRNCSSLPSFPAAAVEVLKLTSENDVELSKVADLIAGDTALSARVLRTVNSSFYGFESSISTIQHAVVVLGLESIRMLVLSVSAVPKLRQVHPRGFSAVRFWQRSLYAATAARILAPHAGMDREQCFLAALLMDIGMLALDQVLGGERYGQIMSQVRSHGELSAAERAELGFSHADAARVLADEWRLPDVLAVPMGYHDRETQVENPVYRRATGVASLAGRCADVFVDPSSIWSIADVRKICMTQYGLDQLAADSMLCSIGQRTRELAPLFEIRLADSGAANDDYETILERANRELLEMTSLKSSNASERRRAPRMKRHGQAQIILCSEDCVGEHRQVRITDVSARGMGFTSPTPATAANIPIGTQFIYEVPCSNGAQKPVRLLYEVVRSTNDRGELHVGAELQCAIDESAIQRAVGKDSAGSCSSNAEDDESERQREESIREAMFT